MCHVRPRIDRHIALPGGSCEGERPYTTKMLPPSASRVSRCPLTVGCLRYRGSGGQVVFHESMCPRKTESQDNAPDSLQSREMTDEKFGWVVRDRLEWE